MRSLLLAQVEQGRGMERRLGHLEIQIMHRFEELSGRIAELESRPGA